MGRRDRNQFSIQVHPRQHAIVKGIRELSNRHNPFSVFSDFVEMGAIALSNRFDFPQRERREKRYMEIVKGYTSEEATKIAHMFAELMLCYQERTDELGSPGLGRHSVIDNDGDVLGKIFSMLDVGNDRLGQYFTPGCVQSLMAQMVSPNEDDIREQIREHGFVTVLEPACGAGGMIISHAENFHNLGFNYPTQLHATCVDKDRLCVHMTYLQLSLRGIPGIVVHGNSLTVEEWDTWYTPPHILLGWNAKLRKRREKEQEQMAIQQTEQLLQSVAESSQPESSPVEVPTHARRSRRPHRAASASQPQQSSVQ